MDASESSPEKMQFLLFPWLAFGHLLPYLELGKCLARRGHAVTFFSTPNNINRLPQLHADMAARLRLVSLPLPQVEGLPDGAEATTDVPPDMVPHLKDAFDLLAGPFSEFFDAEVAGGRKPDWVIIDVLHHWVPPIATRHGIPCAMFYVFPALMPVLIGPTKAFDNGGRRTKEDYLVSPPWIPATSKLAYRRHAEAAMWAEGFYTDNGKGMTDALRHSRAINGCKITSPRSCFELEAPWLALLEEIQEKPVVPTGLVLMRPDKEEHPAATAGSARDIMTWLDQQPAKSVVYVALGSEAPLSTKLVHELAFGLELSGIRFLWALRKPKGPAFDENAGILPEGFEDRTSGRGAVVMSWVPQIRVLSHSSVGAFLTHCGWGSTIEGLHFGLPLIMLPIVIDQPLIAQVMEAKGVGAEIPRDEIDATFDSHGVAETVQRVMADKEMAHKAEKLRDEVFGNMELQEKQFDKFVEYMRTHKN